MADARSNTPRVWLEASDLVDLTNDPGPFITICLATPQDQENAEQHNMLHWRSSRDALANLGASEVSLKEVDEVIADAHLQGNGVYVMADDSGVRHVTHLADTPEEFARREMLPVLAPLLYKRQRKLAHVCVTADRLGAVINAYEPGGNEMQRVVEGDPSDPIHKAQAGGWSQRRFELRVENSWDQHAKMAAEEIDQVAATCKARRIFLAGDVRAVQLIQEHLSPSARAIVYEVHGSRANDGSPLIDQEAVDTALELMVNNDTNALLEKLAEERGQVDRAASGPQEVIDALAQGRVEVLFVPLLDTDDRQCWFGEKPSQIAFSESRVRALGANHPVGGRMVDAMIRSAIGSSSGIRIVEAEAMSNDYAALLRW